MSLKNNATCAICGKSYRICSDVQRSKIKPWRSITDSINCYKIHLVLLDYTNGYADINQTSQDLKEKCDLSQQDSFLPHIQKTIDVILEKSTNDKKKKKKRSTKAKQ